jgi:copper chaperone CopZ
MRLEPTSAELSYAVPGVSCSHCESAIDAQVRQVPGVTGVEVDLDAKRVTVRGEQLDDSAVRAAIADAGYDIAA